MYSRHLHAPASLLTVGLDDITVLQLHLLGRTVWVDPRAVDQKPHGICLAALSLTECVHQPLHGRGTLDLEKNLAGAVADLQVDVGVRALLFSFLRHFVLCA